MIKENEFVIDILELSNSLGHVSENETYSDSNSDKTNRETMCCKCDNPDQTTSIPR